MKKYYNYIMILENLLLTETTSGFTTPSGIDSIIVNYFNNLGWYGNLILLAISLLIATIFGGIIGFQRETNGHPAGFRTHILICLGSALIMIISIYGIPGSTSRDPMRLAAAGVTGVTFLGAGSIVKNGVNIKGLTTAASIWVTMAIGMTCGAGYFVIGLIATIFTMLCLISFQNIENKIKKGFINVSIMTYEDEPIMADLLETLKKYNINYSNIKSFVTKYNGKDALKITFTCKTKNEDLINSFINEFKNKNKPLSIKIIK